MISQWLSWVNSLLVGLIALFVLGAGVYWLKRPSTIENIDPQTRNNGLPKSAFELPLPVYEQMGNGLLDLQQAPPSLQVPDLKQQLVYYGKNGRPDAQTKYTLLHFSLTGNKTVVSTPPGQPLYLIYDRKSSPGRYVFSPNNEKTSLWIEAIPTEGAEAQIKVTLENDKGEKITEPESSSQFRLPEKEFIRYAGTTWELGPFRVDGTLLARQKARWYGVDRFLERHGGDDYQQIAGRQRIDFGENDDIYSVFVKIGDALIWDPAQNRWKVVTPGEESLGHPLLSVKKIEDRLMTFELWDVEGKGKVLLNLLKSTEPWTIQNTQNLQPMFKFLGSRTRTQSIFEINRERVVLSPSDWLLLTPKGWKKLTTEEDIDNYVKRKISGTLFVFEGMVRKDERQVMTGTLYSPTRNDFQTVELALQVGNNKPNIKKETKDMKEVAEANGDRLMPAPTVRTIEVEKMQQIMPNLQQMPPSPTAIPPIPPKN
jgi:hypothetical protein